MRELTEAQMMRALTAFLADVDDGLFRVQPVESPHWDEAERLVTATRLPALRTLDALHLAVASVDRADVFVTADRALASVARALGMSTPNLQ